MQICKEAIFMTKLQGRAESTLEMAAGHGWEKVCKGPNCCLALDFMVFRKRNLVPNGCSEGGLSVLSDRLRCIVCFFCTCPVL